MSVYLICYVAGYLFAKTEHHYLSGIMLMMAAVYLYAYDYRRSHNLMHLRGIFSLFWVGGQGVACLKLSRLQTEWSLMTWVCLALALIVFWVVFEVLNRLFGSNYDRHGRFRRFTGDAAPLFWMAGAVTFLSLTAFIFEAIKLGYIPLFVRDVPHAYSEFHLSGVHYFTVSGVLVPALTVLYLYLKRGRGSLWKNWAVIIFSLVSVCISIMCVSRFQVTLAILLAIFTYFALEYKNFAKNPAFYLLILLILILPPLIGIYVVLFGARSHDVSYLNGIFEMKNLKTPIYITQPYMYIANNYENFNCLVEVLPKHSFGMRSLFPLWALTGLKFLVPSLVNYPIYINKEELTTLTMFYDAYYDFGVIGVCLFSCLLGFLSYILMVKLKELDNPLGYLLYAQIAAYLMLSFFTTWFSNPTTWFYLILTGIMAFVYHLTARRR